MRTSWVLLALSACGGPMARSLSGAGGGPSADSRVAAGPGGDSSGDAGVVRSEEGRVGEKGRSRGWPDHLKKKTNAAPGAIPSGRADDGLSAAAVQHVPQGADFVSPQAGVPTSVAPFSVHRAASPDGSVVRPP